LKLSVLTVSCNSRDTIKYTINSVLSQTYNNIEYIIIDGGSTDGTADLVKSYGKNINKFLSEKDNGIYNAMNKGIKLSSGDIIGFLNSDDVYFDDSIINKVVNIFENEKVDCVYGDLVYVSENNKIKRYWKSGNFNLKSFKNGWMPPHPSFFVKKDVYEKYGGFNENYRISADYELMVRLLYKNKISTFYLPEILVKMKTGGVSNKLSQTFKRLKEDYEIMKEYDLGGFGVMFKKRFYKISQYIHKA